MGFVLLTLAWQENLHRIVYSKLNFTVKKLTPQNTFVWFLVVQHSNFQNFFTGEGYNFLGSHFKGGRDFWAVNRRGAKIFGL